MIGLIELIVIAAILIFMFLVLAGFVVMLVLLVKATGKPKQTLPEGQQDK